MMKSKDSLKLQQSGRSHSKTKIRAQQAQALPSCLRYVFLEAVGFPLASSKAGILAPQPAEGSSSFQTFLFFENNFSLLSGSESLFLQSRRGGWKKFLATEVRGDRANSLHMFVLILEGKKNCVLEGHIAQFYGKVVTE